MSLLLDALKRAEQEKLARQGQAQAAEEDPDSPGPAAKRTLELENVDSPADKSASPAPAAAPATASADRQSVRTAFAAKQPAESPKSAGRNKAVIAIIAVALLALLAGGAYVWFEINKVPGAIARAPMATLPVKPAGPVTAAPVTPAPATPAAVIPAPAQAPAAASKPEAAKPGTVPPVAPLKPADATAKPKPQPKAAEQLVANLLKETSSAKDVPPLKLTRTIESPRVPPDVARGYEALRAGDLVNARKSYEAAIASDPTNLDAHLGLATVAARGGDRQLAARHYRRALELDPRNQSAVAGLAALADFSRPDAIEAQLRADLTRNPQNAALHYTLGNVYAAQSRWNEAQAAYFEAYRLDPDTADIAYNLAVSLDHLGQSRLASDFYRRALAAAPQQSTQFDKDRVTRRLSELNP